MVINSEKIVVPKPAIYDVLTNEKGFIDTFLLTIYMIFFVTILAAGACIGVSVWRVANAEYMWFGEAMDFAARAANINGDLEEVTLNEDLARQYFDVEMDSLMPSGSYTIDSFQTVDTGDSVPHGTANGPGYLANITVEIPAVNVPLIGQQNLSVPMRYFAIAKSNQINNE